MRFRVGPRFMAVVLSAQPLLLAEIALRRAEESGYAKGLRDAGYAEPRKMEQLAQAKELL